MTDLTPEQMAARIAELEGENNSLKSEKTKLLNKNSELIDREKEHRERAEAVEANTGTELEKAQRLIKKLEKERDDAIARADSSTKSLRDYKAESALTAAIASANVDSKHIGMLTKAFRADLEFDESGEPAIGGKSIADFAKEYFAKDGLSYVRAADHNGGGATGSNGTKATEPRMTKENFNWTEFAKWQQEAPEEANAFVDATGLGRKI